jgi:hypothetical protein
LRLWPDFESAYVDKGFKNWMLDPPELVEQSIE